jgi:hypothetical protein
MIKVRCLPALAWSGFGMLLLLLSTGCSALSMPDLPTPYPTEYLPTVLAMTVEAGRSATAAAQPVETDLPGLPTSSQVSPTATHKAASASAQPTRSPTPAKALPTATPTRLPSKTPTLTATPPLLQGEIQIFNPGPMSKVVSPLNVSATYRSVPGGYVMIELLAEPLQPGQAGRPLFSKLVRFAGGQALWLTFQEEIDFEISRVSEFAVLRFSTFDTYNRPVAVASVDLLLLSMGNSQLNPPGDLLQSIDIFEPTKNKLIQGGVLTVSGMTRPEGDQILHFELVAQDERVVGTRDLFTVPAEDGKHISYSTTVEYQVTAATWVRLLAYYFDPRIPGYRQLTSVIILLSP